ncbi:NAD(P)H-binding protein [Companilactobacillus huachuanensis]|uniref:NAD(P)H-binding protein n=1 Tax=Companilactobacillus huachuanensis TaxID=2559914 RepID=A0ABW1RGX1_9LACO|nr:NAD(P)H-binding protein [Companilactobacillus huachuanensis]
MTKYAITGVTGHFGKNAIQELAKLVSPTDIIALARNTEKAAKTAPAGVEVRPGDYTDEKQLEASLKGVDRLLLISSQPGGPVARLTQHENVITAAKNAGVKYIAYTSFPHADKATVPLAADHIATEKFIKESGMNYSFLRNNWYLENEAASLKAAANGQPLVYSTGDSQVGWALESEYSEAAAKVLATTKTKSVYEFAGKGRTYQDLANALGDVKTVSISDEEYQKQLQTAGVDAGTIGIIISIQDLISEGALEEKTADLPDVLGRELEPLKQALQTVISE